MVYALLLQNRVYSLLKRVVFAVATLMKTVTASIFKNISFSRDTLLAFKRFFSSYGPGITNSKSTQVDKASGSCVSEQIKEEIEKKEVINSSWEEVWKEVPSSFSQEERNIFLAHKRAVEANEDMYTDPETGYHVFTEKTLLSKDECCGNACRHCPYGHANVPKYLRTKKFNSLFYI